MSYTIKYSVMYVEYSIHYHRHHISKFVSPYSHVFIKRKDVPYTSCGRECRLSLDGQVGGAPSVGEGHLEYHSLFLSLRLMGPGKFFLHILVSKLSHSMVAPPKHQKGSQSLLQQLEHEYMVCQSICISYNCSCQVPIKR